MRSSPGPIRFRASPFRTVALISAALVVLVTGIALAWSLLPATQEGERPDRLVEAVEPTPPSILPPLTPGLLHVGDARRGDAGWWVLDRRARRVHLLDGELQPVLSFGGRGGAPGEFEAPTALGFRGDSLLVLDAGGPAVIHVFGPQGDFLRRAHVRVEGCDAFAASGMAEAPEGAVLLLGTCLEHLPVPSSGPVVARLDPDGTGHRVQGELRPLRPGSLLPETAVGAPGPGGFWAGRSSRPCLTRLESRGDLGDPPVLCLPEWIGVRFSLGELAGRMNRPPAPDRMTQVLDAMEWLPVMDRVFHHPEGLVLRRLSGMTSRELILLRSDGSMAILGTGLPESVWAEEGEILVAWEGLEGIHLERRTLDPAGITTSLPDS
jgi:hypothetical protein